MLAAVGLLAVGGALLYAGAEAATRGASSLARALGVPAFVLGALLFGIDLEGLGTAVAAAAGGQTSLAAGEIFGTVLFLFSAAFGAALLLSKRPVPTPGTTMVLAPAVPLLVAAMAISDRFVARLEGGLLVALYGAYVWFVVRQGQVDRTDDRSVADDVDDPSTTGGPRSARTPVLLSTAGLVLLAAGAGVAVAGATRFVGEAGLSEGFVGAAILGIVVSLDEVFLEVLPLRRGEPDLATGNLLGTLAAFMSGVLGIAALVRPLDVDSAASLAFLGAALLYTVVATAFLARGRASWGVGLFVLGLYAAWLVMAAEV